MNNIGLVFITNHTMHRISTSNRTKIIIITKHCIDNLKRVFDNVEKPHSMEVFDLIVFIECVNNIYIIIRIIININGIKFILYKIEIYI